MSFQGDGSGWVELVYIWTSPCAALYLRKGMAETFRNVQPKLEGTAVEGAIGGYAIRNF